jgi:hypothetical protein
MADLLAQNKGYERRLMTVDGINQSVPSGFIVPDAEWTVLWHDDFAGPEGAPPDRSRWRPVTGRPWGAGVEMHADDPAHLSLDGAGRLRMTATCDDNGDFTAAWLESERDNFLPPEGGALRIETRMQTAPGTGIDCGMWTWAAGMRYHGPEESAVDAWYKSGELDIVEVLGSNPDTVYASLHSPTCHQIPSLGIGSYTSASDGRRFADDPHTFGVVWRRAPDSITWYLDGREYLHYTPEDTTPEGWLFNQPAFLCMAIIIGSPGGPVMPGTPDPAAFPTTMLISDVTVAEWRG